MILFARSADILCTSTVNLVHGDCLEKMKAIAPESVHLVVTDPPYFLNGLDAGWRRQAFINACATHMLSVMKPGAFAAVFSQPRLAHRMPVGMEDAGFEIRDLLAWHFRKHAQFKMEVDSTEKKKN